MRWNKQSWVPLKLKGSIPYPKKLQAMPVHSRDGWDERSLLVIQAGRSPESPRLSVASPRSGTSRADVNSFIWQTGYLVQCMGKPQFYYMEMLKVRMLKDFRKNRTWHTVDPRKPPGALYCCPYVFPRFHLPVRLRDSAGQPESTHPPMKLSLCFTQDRRLTLPT